MSLSEIETRFAEIRELVASENHDMDVEALNKEVDELEERKTQLNKMAEERAVLIEKAKTSTTVVEQQEERKVQEKMEIREIAALPEYRTGWLKSLMGVKLNEEEQRSVALANAAVVPTATVDKIMSLLVQKAPLLNEVTLFRANGPVNVPVQGTNTAAALHTENAAMDAAADTWTNIALASFEIVKFVRISKSLMNQAIDSFENYLVQQIADKLAEKIESYILYGTGSGQPKGIQYAQSWSDGSNGVDWASSAPTAAEVMELVSYLPGAHFAKAKWVMNHKTFFTYIYVLRDDAKYPIVREGIDGMYYILGRPVLFSAFAADCEYFLGDFSAVVANLSQDIVVDKSEASGFAYNAIDFRGACQFDCDIAIPTAFVKSEATLA